MQNIRNVAVIAHVDHGKTTLIDALLKQTGVFRSNQEEMSRERILDSNYQERERGITITAKNCAILYSPSTASPSGEVKINIIDTPGHADFSGEVERTLSMAEGALLIIDAQEGPMPQTRFVLRKAFEMGLKIIVIINKIDKPYARVPWVIDKTEELFLELASRESELEFPVLYAIARNGKVFSELPDDVASPGDVRVLLDKIVDYIPSPPQDVDSNFKMLVSSFDNDDHLGRILIGKIHSGKAYKGKRVAIVGEEGEHKIEKVFLPIGLGRVEVTEAWAGNIVALSGVNAKIGDTIAIPGDSEPLSGIRISTPTMHIAIGPNTSPFAGREGEFSTSRQIEERLSREIEKNLSLKVSKRNDGKFNVSGRGELHLSVFLENLRREGYEFEAEKPQIIVKEMNGVKMEPVEELQIISPLEHVGVINQEIGKRHGQLINTGPINDSEVEFVYHVPTRAIIGLRGVLTTATKGTAVINSQFLEYRPVGRELPKSRNGVLIAASDGVALSYGLQAAQGRGNTFISPGMEVYEGMIIGKNSRHEDIAINVTKGKKLTNMRSSSSDGVIQLAPPVQISLEQSLDFLETDELLEITPKNLRLRKKHLSELDRRRYLRNKKTAISPQK